MRRTGPVVWVRVHFIWHYTYTVVIASAADLEDNLLSS